MANNQLKVEGLAPRVLPQSNSEEKYVPEFTGGDFDGYSDPLDLIIQIFDERKKYEGSEYPSYLFNTISSDDNVKESDKYFNPSKIATPFYTRYALNSAAKERGYEDLISEEDYEDERLIDSENVRVLKHLATRISEESKERDLTPVEIGFLDRYPSMIADRTGMAKGGLAMNDQMNKLFMARGGLKDDGMNMDPVSGNEVPPGSLAQEVRDDIPAQLSDGEYVVPADVVRYYGVKFFEDLRQEAKTGLSDMEMNGRIGGEPAPDMPSEMPAGLGGEMSEGDITPEMFEALMAQAGGGQAPLRMATGGFASLLKTTSTADKTAKDSSGDIAKIQQQRTFPDQTGIPGYSGQTMTTLGGPTIAQIGTGLPTYVYRYIDPLTGKLIDVKPGETPPPGAIPLETAPVEEEEDYDDGNLWENRPEPVDPKDYDPTDLGGINFIDPVAGAQTSYQGAFGGSNVLSKAPGMLGLVGGAFGELNKLNAISEINANLSVAEERFGVDSAEAKSIREIRDKALENAKLDNITPENWWNGSMRLKNNQKKYDAYLAATGGTAPTGGAGARVSGGTRVTSGGGGDSKYGPGGGYTGDRSDLSFGGGRDDSDSDARRSGSGGYGSKPSLGSDAFDTSKVDAAKSSYGGTKSFSEYQEKDFMSDFDVDDKGYANFGGSSNSAGGGYTGGGASLSFNKGGLMKRKSPVKRK